MKRTVQLKNAGAPAVRQSRARAVKPWRENEPVAVVRSLHTVGGVRPGNNTKRKNRMARKAGFVDYSTNKVQA